MRPDVAAVAATPAINKKFTFGAAKPTKDMVVQVGGAKAGRTLSARMTKKSTAASLPWSKTSTTAWRLLPSDTAVTQAPFVRP
jgi:hypothetical protein